MRLDDDTGLIGKALVIWALVLAIVAVIVLDGGSILVTTFRLSDAAASAASAGAATYQDSHDAVKACTAAQESVQQADTNVSEAKGWCKVNTQTGQVTITLHKRAKTMVAWRFGATADLTKIDAKESASASQL